MNKNVADYTNFTAHHTNNRVLQAPGGNSSINLGWSTEKTDYGPSRHIKKANRQRQYNDQITAKPGQQMNYQQQRNYNNYQTNSQKYVYGDNYRNNKSNSIQYNNGNYGNNNNMFNDMYSNAQKQKDMYSAKLINQQIDSINFGLNKPKSYNNNNYDNYSNNNNNNNNNYNNYSNTPQKYNNRSYDSNSNRNINNNDNKYNLITNQPLLSYPSRQTIQSSQSNQSYRNVYQNNNNNNVRNLQQIDIAIQQYNYNNKKTPTNLQRQQQQQYQQQQYQYRPSVKINGPPKSNNIIGDQNYNYWNDNAGNKYENRVVNTEKKIYHHDRNQGNNYDNQKYERSQRKQQPRTSVKVHNPPGGKQNFVLG